MDNKADIRIEIDPSCSVPQITIRTDRRDEYIEKMISAIEQCMSDDYPRIIAFSGDTAVLLNPRDIVRIYTESRRVIICTDTEEYDSKLPLRELESRLNADMFVRISRFEIVNLRKIFSFDLNITGTIKITFVNKTETWVARRYVRAISDALKNSSKGGRKS